MTDEELAQIRFRMQSAFMYHPTPTPCGCGECDPHNHPKHRLYATRQQLMQDVRTLLTEAEARVKDTATCEHGFRTKLFTCSGDDDAGHNQRRFPAPEELL